MTFRLFHARAAWWGRKSRKSPRGLPLLTGVFSSVRVYGPSNGLVFSEGGEPGCRVTGARPMPCGIVGVLMIDDDSSVAGGGGPAVAAGPRTPYSEMPVARARRANTHELIERLVAEGRVRITGPDDDEVDDERRLVMPSALRRRSLLLLQGLAAEAVRPGYEVRKAGSSSMPSSAAARAWSPSSSRVQGPRAGVLAGPGTTGPLAQPKPGWVALKDLAVVPCECEPER